MFFKRLLVFFLPLLKKLYDSQDTVIIDQLKFNLFITEFLVNPLLMAKVHRYKFLLPLKSK
jgi:hypothetical protein